MVFSKSKIWQHQTHWNDSMTSKYINNHDHSLMVARQQNLSWPGSYKLNLEGTNVEIIIAENPVKIGTQHLIMVKYN